MSKTKIIKLLEEFVEHEEKKPDCRNDYIFWANEEITKLKNALKKEEQRVKAYLLSITLNEQKRKTAHINRRLIKADVRESCRQRKIRLNKEHRIALKAV